MTKLQPAGLAALEILQQLRGVLKAKQFSAISSLGFQQQSLDDVSIHIQAVIALMDRFLIEICQAKRDTKILLRFLNNLCVEVAAADAA